MIRLCCVWVLVTVVSLPGARPEKYEQRERSLAGLHLAQDALRLAKDLYPNCKDESASSSECSKRHKSIGFIEAAWDLVSNAKKNIPILPEFGCSHPGVDPNGFMDETIALDPRRLNQRFEPGTEVIYTCRDGYRLDGPAVLFCLLNGDWSSSAPTCTPTSRTGDCGRSHLQITHRVTNGSTTEAGDWPWTVAVAAKLNNVTVTYDIICGGALIDNKTVLTAAHCLSDYTHFTLYLGKYNRSNSLDDDQVVTRKVTRIVMHEAFNRTTFENDIAMLYFEPNVNYTDRIKPICLPTPQTTEKNIVPGKKGSVAGWGFNELKRLSSTLMVAHLPVQPDDECMDAYEEHGLSRAIQPGMFCAGYREGVVSACRGDSGSPLVFLDGRTHRQTIEGIVSFGHNLECGSERFYTVFTKVAYYMRWILKNWT